MCTCSNNCFIFIPPLFEWCPSLKGPIYFFPLETPLFLSKFSPRQAREYACVVKAFTPFAPPLAFLKTIGFLSALHPLDSSLLCSNSLMEFQPKANLDFFLYAFKSTFIHSIHLSTSEPSNMVFEHFQD